MEQPRFSPLTLDRRVGGVEKLAGLVNEPLDGIAGVESFLNEHDLTWHQVFADWVVANYLDADDERYGYLDRNVGIGPVRRLGSGDGRPDSLSQYSARYYRVDTDADSVTINFEGDTDVSQVGTECPQNPTCWWSGRGDGIDTKLTREFDLTGLDKATLKFQVWHEIEEGWDYGYVQVSDDGGETWHILEGAHTTTDNPSGNGYGPRLHRGEPRVEAGVDRPHGVRRRPGADQVRVRHRRRCLSRRDADRRCSHP